MATIGTVTYPTSTTWEVEITGLTEDQTFTVSDGTDSVQVQLLIHNRLRFSAVTTPFKVSTGSGFAESALEYDADRTWPEYPSTFPMTFPITLG